MNHLLPQSFSSRVGLTSIELADEPTQPMLPEDSQLQPIEAAVERQLEALLQAETFEKVMLDALRPRVREQDILHPATFHALRAEVMKLLEDEYLKGNAAPEVADELEAAMTLLEHLGAAHELGEQYRYALLKG